MKLIKIYLQLLLFFSFLTLTFANYNTKLKFFENNIQLGEINTIQNKKLFSLNDFIKITKSKKFVNDKTEKIIFYINDKKIKVTNEISFIIIDDNLFQLSSKVIKRNNEYYIPVDSFLNIVDNLFDDLSVTQNKSQINFLFTNNNAKKVKQTDLSTEKKKWEFKTIVIDAGHGGKDPGAVGYRGTKEKNIALDVAKRLEKKLSKNMNIKIVMTRDEDIFLRLSERTKIANENNGNLFISIHTNAAEDRRASGFETFLIGPNKNEAAVRVAARENAVLELEGGTGGKLTNEDLIKATIAQSAFASKSELFASMVQQQIKKRVQSKDRGVKQAGFYVLMGASMPNVLVELGFISNPSEEKKLRSPQYRDQLATAIYRAVEQYQKTL
tara:strand:+ start:53 stop:1204 length:1152 start_codon:yes stop_codon:yes gene_type:complete